MSDSADWRCADAEKRYQISQSNQNLIWSGGSTVRSGFIGSKNSQKSSHQDVSNAVPFNRQRAQGAIKDNYYFF
jgi:hypothetical protein